MVRTAMCIGVSGASTIRLARSCRLSRSKAGRRGAECLSRPVATHRCSRAPRQSTSGVRPCQTRTSGRVTGRRPVPDWAHGWSWRRASGAGGARARRWWRPGRRMAGGRSRRPCSRDGLGSGGRRAGDGHVRRRRRGRPVCRLTPAVADRRGGLRGGLPGRDGPPRSTEWRDPTG
jgi:hypothetical protein